MHHAARLVLALGLTLAPAAAWAQDAAAAQVARGREMLAQGDAAGASALAHRLLASAPGNTAALTLAVEADAARAGAAAALATYTPWADAARREEPAALHTVARAVLREAAPNAASTTLKIEMLQALAADGDPDAAAALASPDLQQAAGPGPLAAAGNDQAITALLGDLDSPIPPIQRRAIAALGRTHSRRAITPLIDRLSDPNPDIRGAAAEALGQLGAQQAIGPLKNLLAQPMFPVQYQAASALAALNDQAGITWLRKLESSTEPGIRLAAAQGLRSQADAGWLGLVRDLTTAGDADIRRQAAELLAPHDPAAARAVLEPLMADANVAERDAAAGTYLRTETDLTTLRKYLRDGAADRRAMAARRLLELTR